MIVSRNIRVIARHFALSLCGAFGLLAVSVMPNQDAHAMRSVYKAVIETTTGEMRDVIGVGNASTFWRVANENGVNDCVTKVTNAAKTRIVQDCQFVRYFSIGCMNIAYGESGTDYADKAFFNYVQGANTGAAAKSGLRCSGGSCGTEIFAGCDLELACHGRDPSANAGNGEACNNTCSHLEMWDTSTNTCVSCGSGQVAGDTINGVNCPSSLTGSDLTNCLTDGARMFTHPNGNTYTANWYSNQCISCPTGKVPNTTGIAFSYEERNDDFGRCICAPGTASDGSGGCMPCTGEGNFRNGKAECVSCPAGTSKTASDSECMPCDAGLFSDVGASSCSECPAGQIANSDGTMCDDCPAGMFKAGTSGMCLDCTDGQMSAAGATSCSDCPAGQIANSDGTICEGCPIGTFKAGTSGLCETCADGFVTIATGQTQCSRCAAGQGENAGHTACEPCQPGTFSAGGTSCLPCEDGTFADSASARECMECPAGQAANSARTMCENCPAGTFKAGTSGMCLDCADGQFAAAGAASCNDCPAGQAANSAKTMCENCPTGTFKAGTTGACETCPDGQVTDAPGQTACTSCATGQGENADHSACEPCQPGTFSTGGTSCLPCEAGTVSEDASASACDACPAGSIANAQNTACTACAGEGMGTNDEQTSCITCPAGMYSPNETSGCLECGESEVAAAGSSSCTVCEEGTLPNRAESACMACQADDLTNPTCIECDPGFRTIPNDGGCAQCNVGFHSSLGATCDPCPAGQTSNADFTACVDTALSCPDNQVASHNGDCVICAAGQAPQKDGGAARCDVCPAGTFSEAGDASCSVCAPGTYTNAEGSADCSPCRAGHVPNQNNTACMMCDDGEEVSEDGISCERCAPGEFAVAGTTCEPCERGMEPTSDGKTCVAAVNCGDGMAPNTDGFCECEQGTILKTTADPDRCVPLIECPNDDEQVAGWSDASETLQNCKCKADRQFLNSEGNCQVPVVRCPDGEEMMEDERTGESFCVEEITTPVAVRYNSDNCDTRGWQTGFDLQGSSAAEVCYIPILIVSELPSATASSRDEDAPSPRQSLAPGRKADGCLMRSSNGYIPDEYLRCTAVFGAVGEFPTRRDDFVPTEQSLHVLPSERGVSEVRTAAGEVITSAPSAAVDTPTSGDGTSAVPQGDGGKSSKGVAIGVVAAVGIVTWMLSDGDIAAFNWQPEMSVEHHDGVSYYSYGSRVDFASDGWATHWRASQAHYGGEAQDWVYGAGASWTDGVFAGEVNSRAQGLDTDVGFSLSAEKIAGLWRLRSGVNADWRLDELNSEWTSHLYLSGETIYHDWHFTPSAGFLWEERGQLGNQTFIHLNISRQF